MADHKLTAFQEKVLRVIATSSERMIPNTIGYILIDSKDIVPRRPNPSAQGAAMMVIKPLAALEKLHLIRYDDPEWQQRGYAVTHEGRQYLARVDSEEACRG